MNDVATSSEPALRWPDDVVAFGRATTEVSAVSAVYWGQARDGALRPLDAALRPCGPWQPARALRWDVPVRPSKVLCVGRNYRAHARELGNEVPTEPLLFLKPPSALLAHEGTIALPKQSARVEHEGELAVLVGARLKNADEAQARAAILGYTVANDVTARDLQKRENKFTRAKGFDTFCPLGPLVVRARPSPDARISVEVNGVERQRGTLDEMVFGVETLLAFASTVMTLEPFDVVLTGTPEGVGPLVDGDRVVVHIEGVGRLQNGVTAAP